MSLAHSPAAANLAARLLGRLAHAIARRRGLREQARRRRLLLGLNDHLLRDIGLDPYRVRARLHGRPGLPL